MPCVKIIRHQCHGRHVLLMHCSRIVNWAYNAVDVCMYTDCVAPELNIIDRIYVCQCSCLCAFHHVIPLQAVGLCVCRSIFANTKISLT